jgi:ABC-type transporter Mla subunit MlaD
MAGPEDMVRWAGRLGDEVVRAPSTLRTARLGLGELPKLTDKIDDLIEALNRTTGTIERTLPELSEGIRVLDERFQHVDGVIMELGQVIVTLRDDISGVLGQTTAAIDRVLPELAGVVGGMESRLHHLDRVVSELGETLGAVMSAIPGVRRAVARAARQPAPE